MGQTIDFLLSAKRDKKAAKRFFRRALGRENTRHPREIVTDRLKSYPGALREMKREGELGRFVQHRRGRWLNNLVERDHRRIKCSASRASGQREGRWPGSRRWRCWLRDRCVWCPRTTCRPSGPSSTGSSASPPDRKGWARARPQPANATDPQERIGHLLTRPVGRPPKKPQVFFASFT